MKLGLLVLTILGLAIAGWVIGRKRALASAGGDLRQLHSLPGYYGHIVFLFTAVPAFALIAIWLLAQPKLVEDVVSASIPQAVWDAGASETLVMADVRRIADGIDRLAASGTPPP